MTSRYCQPCKLVNGDYCGPWDDKDSHFQKIKYAHRNCPPLQTGEPKLRGKVNWGNTEIEKAFTNYMIANYDEMFYKVIASCKPDKVCLIKDKWKWVNRNEHSR